MQALEHCIAEAAAGGEAALTTALALLPATVAALDAQRFASILATCAAIEDVRTVASLTAAAVRAATPDQLLQAHDALGVCAEKCIAHDGDGSLDALLVLVDRRRDCGPWCSAALEKAAQTVADACVTMASPPALELLGSLLEAYAEVRCGAEPLQSSLKDADTRSGAKRCLAAVWARGTSDTFAKAADGVLSALEAAAAPEGAMGHVAATEALLDAGRTRRDGALLPLTRFIRAATTHPSLLPSLMDALPTSLVRRHGKGLAAAALGECRRTQWRAADPITALATVAAALGAGGAGLIDDAIEPLVTSALAASQPREVVVDAPVIVEKKRKRRRPPRRPAAAPHWDVTDAARVALACLTCVAHACGPRLRDRALLDRAGAALLDHAPVALRAAALELAAALVAAPDGAGRRSPLVVAARAAAVAACDAADAPTRAAACRLQAACDAVLRPRCAPLAPPPTAPPPPRGDLLAALFPGDDSASEDDEAAAEEAPAAPAPPPPAAPVVVPPAAPMEDGDDDEDFPDIIT